MVREPFGEGNSLFGRVAGKGVGVLDHFGSLGKRVQRHATKSVAEDGLDFIRFMGIARREDQGCHVAGG